MSPLQSVNLCFHFNSIHSTLALPLPYHPMFPHCTRVFMKCRIKVCTMGHHVYNRYGTWVWEEVHVWTLQHGERVCIKLLDFTLVINRVAIRWLTLFLQYHTYRNVFPVINFTLGKTILACSCLCNQGRQVTNSFLKFNEKFVGCSGLNETKSKVGGWKRFLLCPNIVQSQPKETRWH